MGIASEEKTYSLVKRHFFNISLLKKFSVLLLLFAYLSHLSFIPLDTQSDEARRAIVSAEMVISKNYITPTINGEIYLNKPPLYNWIVACYFKVFGNYSMFAFRLQMIVAIFLTGGLIYFFTKKYVNADLAFFAAMAYMTNGRLMIYDSLFGNIDTTFSLCIYAGMMLIFYYGEEKKYYGLFIVSYILCLLGFWLKGLPALAFQALSLFAYFIYTKNLKKILSIQHLCGLLVFILLFCSYYFIYFSVNKFSASILFDTIFNESVEKSYNANGFLDNVKHLFTFPFEILYHFLPWTIFIVALLKKNLPEVIKQNNFIVYLLLVFAFNIPVYWFSSDVYPKYIFMFIPLLYTVMLYCFFGNPEMKNSITEKITIWLLYIFCFSILAFTILTPFLEKTNLTNYFYLKVFFLIIVFSFTNYMLIKSRYRFYFMLLTFIFFRFGFNWFVIERRAGKPLLAQNWAKNIVQITNGNHLYISDSADTGNFDGMSFYISTARNEILRKKSLAEHNAYFIVDEKQVQQKSLIPKLKFENFPGEKTLYLIYNQ